MKQVIQIKGAPAPIGPYSQAILQDDTLYVSGQIPIDPFTGKMQSDSVEKATNQVLKNIEAILDAAGMELKNIVKCSIFLNDLNDFSVVNTEYAKFFQENPPARETVQVARLPMDAPLEISCIAKK